MMEALRFHKLKDQLFVQVLFIITLIVQALFNLFPPGDPNFQPYLIAVIQIPTGEANLATVLSTLDMSHVIYFAASFVLGLFTTLVMLVYAGALVSEADGFPALRGAFSMLRRIPALLALGLLLLVPFILSLAFMLIPFLVILTFLAFTPLFLSSKKLKLGASMSESIRLTQGVKLNLFLSFFLLTFLFNLPQSIALALVPLNRFSQGLITAFFSALLALMRGRLLGLYFVYFVNRFPLGAAGFYRPGDPRKLFAEIGRVPPEVPTEDDALDTRLPGEHRLPEDDEEDEEEHEESRFPWQSQRLREVSE